MGNSATHSEGQIGTPHTVVFATELSTEAILAGIRSGRSWIAESEAVEVSFAAGVAGYIVGERLATRGGEVKVQAEVHGVPEAPVSFHSGRGGFTACLFPAMD
ncbi:hypothetical protein ACFVZD_32245 [Streptomyces sp. NPDC058287]|uniref:hypothetical protein n=1 Tax=unclassified Streptomyces TaxID=2593676 RepID=UPI0036DFA898